MVIVYEGEPISVPKEVAEFLEQDRKREQAEAKRDKRHLSKGDLERVLSAKSYSPHTLDDHAIRNLRLENLREAIACLDESTQELLQLRYYEELSLEKIGAIRGVSKMAISKQLKKVHEELRSSVW